MRKLARRRLAGVAIEYEKKSEHTRSAKRVGFCKPFGKKKSVGCGFTLFAKIRTNNREGKQTGGGGSLGEITKKI